MKKSVKSILNGLGVAILVFDHKEKLIFANGAGLGLFPSAEVGAKLDALLSKARTLREIRKVWDEKRTIQSQATLQNVVPTSYRITAAPMMADDRTQNVILSFEDVSHIRDAEKMREDFVANVSHELRSPLTALYGFIETLQGPAKEDGAATEKFLQLMQKEAERMARLIDDLLSLSKLQASERVSPTGAVHLGELIQRVCENLQPLAAAKGVRIKHELSHSAKKIAGEEDELTQVFQNLIENAIKYGAKDGEVTISQCDGTSKEGFICTCVSDQGEGIDPKHIPRLTERFYRVDKGRSRAIGGTGLGLAIVKHILIRHRGFLEISSELGKGTNFKVYLPHQQRN